MKLESIKISNADGKQKIIKNPSIDRYKQFQFANNIINSLCERDNLYEDLYEVKKRLKELQNENRFNGKYEHAERVMLKKIEDMQLVLENNVDENGTKKFYSAFGICIDHYNMVKGENYGG